MLCGDFVMCSRFSSYVEFGNCGWIFGRKCFVMFLNGLLICYMCGVLVGFMFVNMCRMCLL